jgi:glucosamine--fructose-6-phosphate aminotransferase (isomerizing)
MLAEADSLATSGRGPTLAIARECKPNAEGFSAAEFQHGPISLLSKRYPVFVFTPNDATGAERRGFARSLTNRGAQVLCTEPVGRLPWVRPDRAD